MKLIIVQIIRTPHRVAQTLKQNEDHAKKLHQYLSLLLSHSSCASRRILSSSPCRAEEMLSSGPVRLSLRLTAAISSSSSTQEPDEETRQAAEFIMMLRLSARRQRAGGLQTHMLDGNEAERSRDEESKQTYGLRFECLHWVQYFCWCSSESMNQIITRYECWPSSTEKTTIITEF